MATSKNEVAARPETPLTSEELKIQYQDVLGRLERLRETVVVQVMELLSANNIPLGVPIESRVKSWASIEEKLQRKSIDLPRINDLEDLVGIRLILLFRNDVESVLKIISENLTVVSSEDTADRLGDSEFGYQSRHFIVQLPQTWLTVPSLANLSDFYIELQVRTLAQHVWAAASHKLQYKNESSVPPPLRRTINRISALLETVDLEFDRILEERNRYVEKTKTSPVKDEPLNVDSLAAVLSEVFPSGNKKEGEPYASLLSDLTALGVSSADNLREVISRHRAAIENSEAEQIAKSKELGAGDIQHYYAHVGLARLALRSEFGSAVVNKVMASRRTTARKRRVRRAPLASKEKR